MTIIVEDGTGLSTAESYISLERFNDFCIEWGYKGLVSYSVEDQESALRRATVFFDSNYGSRFLGTPLQTTQKLVFPMTDLIDARSYAVPEFPQQVKDATGAIAWFELTNPRSLFPVVTPSKTKKLVTAGGTSEGVTVEYFADVYGSDVVRAARPVLSLIEGILAPIGGSTYSVSGSSLYGSAMRG